MAGRLPHYNVRRAVIRKVGKTFVDCEFADRRGEALVRCPMPHPYAGQLGGGIFFQPEIGSSVLISRGPMEGPFIVRVIPERELYFGTEGVENTAINTTPYPQNLKPGEICIKGPTGSRLDFLNTGNVTLRADIGSKASNLEFSQIAQGLFTRINNQYCFTEAGRKIEGVIKRDKSRFEAKDVTDTFSFLDGEAYDNLLKTIGRSPNSEVHYRTTNLISSRTRNPSLIEKRSIIYEYADSFNVKGVEDEAAAMENAEQRNPAIGFDGLTKNVSSRKERRTDVLNLNLRNYNHLIEKVEGTLVDIYGNILDVNRNKIPVPEITDINTSNRSNILNDLNKIYGYLRRSVKLHYEINSRKNIPNTEPSRNNFKNNNGKNFSKFSIDVDGEGLTKINIPASSETGNIPVLGRYVNSVDNNDKDSGAFRDEQLIDVRMLPFSPGGPSIRNSVYKPRVDSASSDIVTAGTAHHNMLNTASSVFNTGKHKNGVAISESINNNIGDSEANAGGRSINLNLDGSSEISIGADTVDRKSVMLDLAGGIISRYGRDKNGRSILHQSDGDIIVQIGGSGIDDKRFSDDNSNIDRPGRLELHLLRPGGDPQKIIIDEDGITISVNGNAVYSSTGDTTISARGNLLLHGETIGVFGSHDESVDGTRASTGFERFIARNGNIIS